jgi:isopenicillin-N epimerase
MLMVFLRPVQSGPSLRTRLWYCVQNRKWLSGPPGSAFLYARREVQGLLEPLVVTWGWNRDVGRVSIPGDEGAGMESRPTRFVDENEWQGTRDPAAYLSVPAAIR